MQWLDFAPLAEFVDRSGITRSIYGCSLLGRFEFAERQERMKAILDAAAPETTWEELCATNRDFRAAVDRCLVLNRIDPDWVTPGMVEQLLFARRDGDRWLPGWLVELNSFAQSESSSAQGDSASLPEILAALSLSCAGLQEAIDLATNVPANLLMETMRAKGELLKTPEQREEQNRREQLADLRANYGGLVCER